MMTTGWRKKRFPTFPLPSSPERSSSAGELMAPPHTTTVFAFTVSVTPVGRSVSGSSSTASTPPTRRPPTSTRRTEALAWTVSPFSTASGMSVTSIDCLASSGQPSPQ